LDSILRTSHFSLILTERMFSKRGGGSVNQPLSYLDPTELPSNASAGSNLLEQNGLILRPRIGGGSTHQSLPYIDDTIGSPSAPAGIDLLKQSGLIVRPAIGGFNNAEKRGGFKANGMSDLDTIAQKRGGFLPSVMKGVVNSGAIVAPLAVFAARRMLTAKKRRGGGKKEDWARNRNIARSELEQYGKPSALNINKYAALKRKNVEGAEDWLVDYIVRKRKSGKTKKVAKAKANNRPKTASMWKNLVAKAKNNLGKYGKPSGANISKFASLRKRQLNTKNFLANFKTRKQYHSPVKMKTAKNKYRENLQEGRQYLSQFGKPTVTNVAKFVSLKRRGENTGGIEVAVKSRVKPVTPKFTVKPTHYSPPPF
jgi:hypothetical protein